MVKLLTADQYPDWDNLLESSLQGTLFSSSAWLKLMGLPFKIYGYYQGNNLIGGMANFDSLAPLTPFQGIIVKDIPGAKYATKLSLLQEVTSALIPFAPHQFYNHWTFNDIRPFKWAGWQCDVRYTYVVDISDMTALWNNLEKQTRYEITHAQKSYSAWMTSEIRAFDSLYSETFKRKGLERPISTDLLYRLGWNFEPAIFFSGNEEDIASMAIFIDDGKRAYYILGASGEGHTSSLTLWYAFERLAKAGCKEVDLVGCNNREIALFKRGFGGKLTPYYGVKRNV